MEDTDLAPHDLPLLDTVLGGAAARHETRRLVDGLSYVSVPDPGRSLNLNVQRRIYQALVPVTTRSFSADMTPYWAQRSREGYLERLAEFVLVVDGAGAMVGWTGFHLLPFDEHTIVYLDSTGLVPEWQSRGAMRALMRRCVADSALPRCAGGLPVYLTARTESPIFYRLMQGLLPAGQLYPNGAAVLPEDIAAVGRHLADWLGQLAILDPTTLMLRGAYDALDELYGELPTTGDPQLDTLFRDQLGPLDAFLLVGRASP